MGTIHIQYWCIDGKYRIYVGGLENWGKTTCSESFHLFRAESHKFYIYRQYTNIVFTEQTIFITCELICSVKRIVWHNIVNH